jgi:hypothetical protein
MAAMADTDAAAPARSTVPAAARDWVWTLLIVATMIFSSVKGLDILAPRTAVGGVSVMWAPSAVLAVAVLRTLERSVWIAVHVVAFLVTGLAASFGNTDTLGTFAFLLADLLEVAIAVAVWAAWGGPRFQLDTVGAVTRHALGVIAACAISGLLVTLFAMIRLGPVPTLTDNPAAVGIAWTTSNIATHLVIGAMLLVLSGRGGGVLADQARARPWAHAGFAAALVVLSSAGMMAPSWILRETGVDLGNGSLVLLAAPLAAYAACRHGPVGAGVTAALVGVPAIYATAWGFGPFGESDAPNGIFELQISLTVSTFALLLIGAMAAEMRERREALERALDKALGAEKGASTGR